MAIKFRKRLKIAPGLNINLSKSGASVSLGKRGATVNLGGKGGAKATVGILGSGLSVTQRLSKGKSRAAEPKSKGNGLGFFGLLGYSLLAFFLFLVLRGLFFS